MKVKQLKKVLNDLEAEELERLFDLAINDRDEIEDVDAMLLKKKLVKIEESDQLWAAVDGDDKVTELSTNGRVLVKLAKGE